MKAIPAMTRGTKQCQRRSSKRRLLQPTPIMATAVGTYRMLVMRASLALCHACNVPHTHTCVSDDWNPGLPQRKLPQAQRSES